MILEEQRLHILATLRLPRVSLQSLAGQEVLLIINIQNMTGVAVVHSYNSYYGQQNIEEQKLP